MIACASLRLSLSFDLIYRATTDPVWAWAHFGVQPFGVSSVFVWPLSLPLTLLILVLLTSAALHYASPSYQLITSTCHVSNDCLCSSCSFSDSPSCPSVRVFTVLKFLTHTTWHKKAQKFANAVVSRIYRALMYKTYSGAWVTDVHIPYISRTAVPFMWGSLRLAPMTDDCCLICGVDFASQFKRQ